MTDTETVWINQATGEIARGSCPYCVIAEEDVHKLEMERRDNRRKITALEKQIEGETTAARSGAVWKEIVTHWIESTGRKADTLVPMKGVRATLTFRILEAGADVEKVKRAIDGAVIAPYKSYGRRTSKPSGKKLDDLKDICKNEAEFEELLAVAERGSA